jgi:gluconokinase
MVITLDIGTSSARAALWDRAGRAVDGRFHQVRYAPATTADGGVEHDAERLLQAVVTCLDAVLAGRGVPDVAAVGVATFWHGLLGFDASDQPATPVYMWADTRSAPDAALLRDALDEAALHARTGCHLHSSYWPAKLRWLARERPAEVRRVVRWGSFGEHLELALFGDAATTISMASGTGLFDQEALRWAPDALAAAGVDGARLFPLCDRTDGRHEFRPRWSRRWPALRGVPWFPAVGDGASGNVGSDCTDPSRVALNLGTSVALRVITATPPRPPRGLWRYRLDRDLSVLGGALSEGGNVYAWCREVLRLPGASDIEAALAAMAPDAHGLTMLPFLAGERAPGWRGDRRAVIAGLGLDTTPLQIARAALEAVTFRVALVYDLLAPCATPGHAVVASGGGVSRSRLWTQIVADVLGRPVTICREEEATSRGAALLALSAVGALDRGQPAEPAVEMVEPDEARHARYLRALERQRDLDRRLG